MPLVGLLTRFDPLVSTWSVVLDYYALYTVGIRVVPDGVTLSKDLVPVVQKESSVYCTIQRKQNDHNRLREETDATAVTSVGFLPIFLQMKVMVQWSGVTCRISIDFQNRL